MNPLLRRRERSIFFAALLFFFFIVKKMCSSINTPKLTSKHLQLLIPRSYLAIFHNFSPRSFDFSIIISNSTSPNLPNLRQFAPHHRLPLISSPPSRSQWIQIQTIRSFSGQITSPRHNGPSACIKWNVISANKPQLPNPPHTVIFAGYFFVNHVSPMFTSRNALI